MSLILETPTKLRLPPELCEGKPLQELQDYLGYTDLRVGHELRRWKDYRRIDNRPGGTHWFVAKNGREALDDKIRELELLQSQTLLFRDERGYWTYGGLSWELCDRYGEACVSEFDTPVGREIPWFNEPPYEAYWYQKDATQQLVEVQRGAVELATGLGKSFIIALILKQLGLSAVIIAPYLNIAQQLLKDLKYFFGPGAVGQFFGGTKQPERQFVVAVSKSVLNCKPGDKNWNYLAGKDILIGDESHLLPAETLSEVILDMLGNIPYRFFLSGTQLRTDGLDLVLNGIVGEMLMRMNVRQGVEGGYLSPLQFISFRTRSDIDYTNLKDPVKMNRVHLHGNERVYAHAGKFISAGVRAGRRCLVLVEELKQFLMLLPYLQHEVGFAHGGVSKKNKNDIPTAYHKSNPMELVARFDAGEYPILVGTSCIGTGTDIKSTSMAVDLVGGKAETRVRQNVGRCTRLFDGKYNCIYADYDVTNIPMLHNQAKTRQKIHNDIYGPVDVRNA